MKNKFYKFLQPCVMFKIRKQFFFFFWWQISTRTWHSTHSTCFCNIWAWFKKYGPLNVDPHLSKYVQITLLIGPNRPVIRQSYFLHNKVSSLRRKCTKSSFGIEAAWCYWNKKNKKYKKNYRAEIWRDMFLR